MDKEYNEIISHDRIYEKGKESMKWYPYLKTMSKRPNAIKYTSFYNELPNIWKDYISNQTPEEKKKTIKMLMKMIEGEEKEDIANATIAIEETIKKGITDIDSIYLTYYRLKNKDADAINAKNEINIKFPVPKITTYKTNINIYDTLYKKEVTAI